MKNIFKLLTLLLAGFAGGCIAPMFFSLFRATSITGLADAVAIANTYIVFTTIIFVGFTVVLGIAGYVFTQQFSANKQAQENELMADIRKRLEEEEDLGIEFLSSLVKNPDVLAHLKDLLQTKVDELIAERVADSQACASQAAQDAAAVSSLASQLKKNKTGVAA